MELGRQQIIQIQMMEQEVQQLNKQLQLIEQNISEMQDLKISFNEIENKENKKILTNLGKGIYLPVEIKEKKLIVEVGNKNFVKKTIPQTKEIIEDQLKKLISAKDQILEKLEALQTEITRLMEKLEKTQENVKK